MKLSKELVVSILTLLHVMANSWGIEIGKLPVNSKSACDIVSLDTFVWIGINRKHLKTNDGSLVGITRHETLILGLIMLPLILRELFKSTVQ